MFQQIAKFVSQLYFDFLFNLLGLKATNIHLKRVIVTPAVYWLLAPLNRSLKYQHWADVTSYTHPCGLAGS